jgi:hypothetical protein
MQYKVIKEEMGYYCSDIVYYIAYRKNWCYAWRYLIEKQGKIVFHDTRIAAEKHIEDLKKNDQQFEKKISIRTNIFIVLINYLFKKDDNIN